MHANRFFQFIYISHTLKLSRITNKYDYGIIEEKEQSWLNVLMHFLDFQQLHVSWFSAKIDGIGGYFTPLSSTVEFMLIWRDEFYIEAYNEDHVLHYGIIIGPARGQKWGSVVLLDQMLLYVAILFKVPHKSQNQTFGEVSMCSRWTSVNHWW